MTRVLLVRHGESTANAQRVWQGHTDYPLSDTGRSQAAALARSLAGTEFDELWSSPLGRAWGTAEGIARATGYSIHSDDRLREIDIGIASGLTHDDVSRRFPERTLALERGDRWEFPGQEPHAQFTHRVHAVLDEMLRKDGAVAAVTHGGFIRRAVFDILGFPEERAWPFSIANCSITEIVMDRAGNRVVHRLNDACHLD